MGFTGNRAFWEAETGGAKLLEMTVGQMLDRQ